MLIAASAVSSADLSFFSTLWEGEVVEGDAREGKEKKKGTEIREGLKNMWWYKENGKVCININICILSVHFIRQTL